LAAAAAAMLFRAACAVDFAPDTMFRAATPRLAVAGFCACARAVRGMLGGLTFLACCVGCGILGAWYLGI
jgi:hypothetical protein